VLFLALESPIDVAGDKYLFSFHMLQHLLLAMIVPPLLLLGLPDEWRAFYRIRVSPLAASVVFNLVLAIWHVPFLYEATLRNEPVHVLEHLTFLAVGVLFWWPLLVPEGRDGSMSVMGKIAYLGFAGVPPTILGLAFILSPTVIYPFYAAAPLPRVGGLSPLDDQQIGGLLMWVLGGLMLWIVMTVIWFRYSVWDQRGDAESAVPPEAYSPSSVSPKG